MQPSSKPIVMDAEPDETNLIIEEIDNLITGAEARIARQQEYVRSLAAGVEGSKQATVDLERMISSLGLLKRQRARIVRWEDKPPGNG
jgi:hypothetical protein